MTELADLAKWFSRKLAVLIAATFLFSLDKISEQTWLWAVGIYLGTQGVIDVAESFKKGKHKDAP